MFYFRWIWPFLNSILYNTLIKIIKACKHIYFSGYWANICLNMRVPGLQCMASGVEHLETKEQKGKLVSTLLYK